MKEDEALLETMNTFYAAPRPDEMTIDSNWRLDMNGKDQGTLEIRWTLYYDGSESDCDNLLEKYIKNNDLKDASQKRTIPEPTTRFSHEMLFLMWEEEARLALPRMADNSYQLWCSFVFAADANMPDVIKAGKEEQDLFEQQLKYDNASMWVTFIHSGGQTSNKGNDSTSACPWRKGVFQYSVLVKWGEKWLEMQARDAILRIKSRLTEYSVKHEGECASYINFSDATLAVKGEPQKAYYGQNHAELEKLKQERDPRNFFNWP